MPRPKLIIYASALLLSLGSGLSSLQEKPDGHPYHEQSIQSFEKFAAQQMAFGQTPGISVDFIKNDLTWVGGSGYADLDPSSGDVSKGLGDMLYRFGTK